MKDTNLPPLPRQASDQRTNRQIPTEALTFYSKALLFQDRGQKDKAAEMYQRALAVSGVHRGAARPPAREELVT